MRVLIACEYSQRTTKAFRDLGHEAFSCDFEEPEINADWHIYGDVLDVINDGWDLMIAHPPCTYLANSGVSHLHSIPSRTGKLPKVHGPERWDEMKKGAQFFKALLNAPIPKIAIENPIPHRYAVAEIGAKYTQVIQPRQFGHG